MKKKFSTAWKASKKPRKQRKYLARAPIHLKRKMMGANLSKELRKKHGKKTLTLRKGDIVKVMRGKFKGKTGKVLDVKLKRHKIQVENIQVKKQDGSKVNAPLRASNLQIIELNLEDKKRNKAIKETKGKEKIEKDKKENEKEAKEKSKSGSQNKSGGKK
jgi:large subunit ribosomal protein L24